MWIFQRNLQNLIHTAKNLRIFLGFMERHGRLYAQGMGPIEREKARTRYIALTGRGGIGELSTQPVRLFEAGIERPRAGCPCHGIGQLALPRFCAGRDAGGTGYDLSLHLPEDPKKLTDC
jgi:hypothetical protein